MKQSVRLRYVSSFLLIATIPIVLFSIFFYTSNLYHSRNQVNQNRQTAFNQASTQTDYLLSEIENTVLRLSSNLDRLVSFSDPFTVSVSDSQIISDLDRYENTLPSGLRLGLYIRGDTDIYLSDAKYTYSEFEQMTGSKMTAIMSGLFTKLNSLTYPGIFQLYNHTDVSSGQPSGGNTDIYIIPVPYQSTHPAGSSICIIPHSSFLEIFENVMGTLHGNLYIYKDYNSLIYSSPSPYLPEISFNEVRSVKGIGAIEQVVNGHNYIILRNVSTNSGLTCMLVMEKKQYFDHSSSSAGILIFLFSLLISLCVILALLMARYNYRPIQDLFTDITGIEDDSISENELNTIRTVYQESKTRNEQLTLQISMQNNIARDQFLLRLIQGKCRTQDEVDYFSSCLEIQISFSHYLVLVGSISNIQNHRYVIDQILEKGKLLFFDKLQLFVTEAGLEEQIIGICCFDEQEGNPSDFRKKLAETIHNYYAEANISHVIWGVSLVTDSIFQLHQAYMEAAAVLQAALWLHSKNIYYYTPDEEKMEASSAITTMQQSLLIESIRHGNTQMAQASFDALVEQIRKGSCSLLITQMLCYDLLNVILKTVSQMNVSIDFNLNQNKDVFRSLSEFHQYTAQFLTSICGQIEQRREQNNTKIKNDVIQFIQHNFKESTFSLDYIAEQLQLSKARINSIIKEDLGYSFGQYIIALRINEVKRLLVETDLKIQDIVTSVGYIDVSNFVRKFKNLEGVTPGQFRQLHKK